VGSVEGTAALRRDAEPDALERVAELAQGWFTRHLTR
jgi:hypothetical protein